MIGYRKGLKARPHDIEDVLKAFPDAITLEIHATSDDIGEKIKGKYDQQLCVHLPEYNGDNLLDPSCANEDKRQEAATFYAECLKIVRKWGEHFRGKPKAIMHPGGWTDEVANAYEQDVMLKQLERTVTEMNKVGVDLLLENMPPNPWFYGGQWCCNALIHPRQVLDFCMRTGRGLCLDLCHAHLFCQHHKFSNVIEYAKKVKPVVAHIHISDALGRDGEGKQIGEGDMPLKKLWGLVRQWNVAVIPEIWQGHKDDYAGFKTCWERLGEMEAQDGGNDREPNNNGTQ